MNQRQEIGADDPFAGQVRPPGGLWARLKFYGERNGYLYAILSYVGRHAFAVWTAIAPRFAKSRIDRWLAVAGPRIVNLGGGANVFDRWLTADVDPRADVYVDVLKPLPFPDSCLDAVYLEEVVEHVVPDAARRLIHECHRVLKPQGTLRLTTPNLDAFVAQYDESEPRALAVNEIFYEHGHRHIYGARGIEKLLREAGFARIARSSFRDPAARYGHFDTHALRYSLSEIQLTQYWEATKGG